MGKVIPELESAVQISKSKDMIDISIRVRSRLATRIILFMFLLIWVVLGSSAIADLTNFAEKDGVAAVLPFLIGWGVASVFVVVAAAWNFKGMERVSLDRNELKHRREVFGFGFGKEYATQHIGKFRVGGGSALRLVHGMEVWGMGPGVVSFDYGVKTYRLGSTLEDSEAEQVVASLQSQIDSFRNSSFG